MSYLLTAAALLIELAFGLVTALFLLRLALPLVRANFRNPICQTIYRLSHPVVAPVGRLLKPIGRFDLASAVLIWLLQCLKFLLLYALGGLLPTLPGLLVLGLAAAVPPPRRAEHRSRPWGASVHFQGRSCMRVTHRRGLACLGVSSDKKTCEQ